MAVVDDVAAGILARTGEVETYKLQKLLYYAQGWHLALTGRRLFADQVEAWRYGPVVDAVYQQHRKRRRVGEWSGNAEALDATERDIVELVCSAYGGHSGQALSEASHQEFPWRHARKGLPEDASSRNPLTDEDMIEYFGTEATLGGFFAADLLARGIPAASLVSERDGETSGAFELPPLDRRVDCLTHVAGDEVPAFDQVPASPRRLSSRPDRRVRQH